MAPAKIMLIRHAEKPLRNGGGGVNERGEADKASLSVRGWQRAGALVRLFDPIGGIWTDARVARPTHIYATRIDEDSKEVTRRPLQTVEPLALSLGLTIDDRFAEGSEQDLVADGLSRSGVVLISWTHDRVAALVDAIGANAPKRWPDDRFDAIWLFEPDGAKWTFSQAPQMLLAGDRLDPIE